MQKPESQSCCPPIEVSPFSHSEKCPLGEERAATVIHHREEARAPRHHSTTITPHAISLPNPVTKYRPNDV